MSEDKKADGAVKLIFWGIIVATALAIWAATYSGSSTNNDTRQITADSGKPFSEYQDNKDAILAEIKALADQGYYQAAFNKTYEYRVGGDADMASMRKYINGKKGLGELEAILKKTPPKETQAVAYELYCQEVHEAYVQMYNNTNDEKYNTEGKKWHKKWAKIREKRLYAQAKALPASAIMENESAYKELSMLNPDNKTYRSKYLHYSKKAAHIRNRQGKDIELLSWKWYENYGYVKAEGQIQNISGRKLERVMARVTWYDKNGTMITSDASFIDYDPVMPGQRSSFTVMERFNPMMEKASIDFVTFGGARIPFIQK